MTELNSAGIGVGESLAHPYSPLADSGMSNPMRTHHFGGEQTRGFAYGPLWERGALDGVLIRLGGKDDTVPVHLLDGDKVRICNANRDVARRLAPSLFGPILRVHGEGRWERDQDGNWNLLRFDIRHFKPLDEVPLVEAVERLRAVKGSGWPRIPEPARELHRLRGG